MVTSKIRQGRDGLWHVVERQPDGYESESEPYETYEGAERGRQQKEAAESAANVAEKNPGSFPV